MTVQEWLGDNQLSIDIWNNKYRHNNESFNEWLDRVSGNNSEIKRLIIEKKFLFGGRTLANRGIEDAGSYSNCYSVGYVPDSLSGIMDVAKQIAETFKAQGGQGLSLSKIRPKGTLIGGQFSSDGIVPFMHIFNTVTESVSQGGSRKGALMMSIDAWHKEAIDFIKIKEDLNEINKANLSVEIDDAFMNYVNSDTEVEILRQYGSETIKYKVNPKKIFDTLCESAWKSAEPGILFVDKLRNYNIMELIDEYSIETTNPCGEQPLPPHGACNLSSINVSKYVVNPFTTDAYIDWDTLGNDIAPIVEEMDKVLEENAFRHALPEQIKMALTYRNIGIGIMGLADMFVKLGVKYGSANSVEIASTLMQFIFKKSVEASVNLAEKLGNFPGYDDKVWDSEIMKNAFDAETLKEYKQKGKLRNCSLLSVAPTGSIGTMLNISTGVEPFFALSYKRRTESMSENTYEVNIQAVDEYKKVTNNAKLLDYFVTSSQIPWKERIDVQAALQEYVDTAISSTINLPKETTVQEVRDLYIYAWKKGLKGVTIYREGSRNPILSTSGFDKETFLDTVNTIPRGEIGQVLIGKTYKYRTACGTLYVTVNTDEQGNIVEIFTNSSKNGTCKANLNGETRLASLALRGGIKTTEVIDALKTIQCQSCAFAKAKGLPIDGTSCPDVIAKCLKQSYKQKTHTESVDNSNKCPECGSELKHEGGCVSCNNCGYSKCQ